MAGETMSSAGAIVLAVGALSLALGCLAAMSSAVVEASSTGDDGRGGLLHIPSNASLAHCPSSCGDVDDISYPFGIGPGCFRQGFELICDHTAAGPPKLFLGMNTTDISWVAPAKGITIDDDNTFYVVGCDFDVNLLDYARTPVGSCFSRCQGEKLIPNGGLCNGIGCCFISLTNDMTGFRATIVRHDGLETQSKPQNPGIMLFMSYTNYYQHNTTDLFSGLTNASDVFGALLDIAVTDQPSCKSALMTSQTYACPTGSTCTNASYGGYRCSCPSRAYTSRDVVLNPYVLEGCQQVDYNPKRKEHCPTSCGSMDIPFPFGLTEGCYASKRSHLNCTENNTTIFSTGVADYRVTGVSIENGTLTVVGLHNASSGKEVMVALSENNGVSIVIAKMLPLMGKHLWGIVASALQAFMAIRTYMMAAQI